MKFHFSIHENYLFAHLINKTELSDKSYQNDLTDLRNKAWDISQAHYNLLLGRAWLPIEHDSEVYQTLPDFIDKVKQTKEFQKILRQTQEYLKFCQKDWEETQELCEKILIELTGFDLKQQAFTVYLTHPGLRNGRYLGNQTITFGHHEDWPHYSVIYFCHEILHAFFGKTDLDHALIELLTDEELRVRLNDGKYPPYAGHKRLSSLKDQILSHWRKYVVRTGKKGILKFREELVHKHNIAEGSLHS